MKKLLIVLFTVLFVTLVSCSYGTNESKKDFDNEYPNYNQNEPIISNTINESFKSLDDVIQFSTNIVKAELISIENFDTNTILYKYKVIEDYIGNTELLLNIYEIYNEQYNKFYKINNSYYLFLLQSDIALYPHTIYTSAYKNLFLACEPFKVILNGVELEYNENEIVNIINTNINNLHVGIKASVLPKIEDIDDLYSIIENADAITKIQIINERTENKYASTYSIKIIDTLKGKKNILSNYIILQPGLKEGNDYYIFHKKYSTIDIDEGYILFSRKYIAVNSESEEGKIIVNTVNYPRP